MIRVRLAHHLAAGDSLVLSSAIRSLHLEYPGQYVVDVDCTARELFDGNPDVTRLDRWDVYGHVDYGPDMQNGVHFMGAMCRGVGRVVGRPMPLRVNRPVLVLSEQEQDWSGPLLAIADRPMPYILLNCGGKRDFTAKIYGETIAQEVVDHYRDTIRVVQVGTSNEVHPRMDGVVNLIDRTTVRELAQVVHHATVAVGPVTLVQHIAAAVGTAYVLMGGGREPVSFTTYPEQIDLHTFGKLDCCRERACWSSRVVPLGDLTPHDRRLCSLPVVQPGGEIVPRCHQMIGADGIIRAVDAVLDAGL